MKRLLFGVLAVALFVLAAPRRAAAQSPLDTALQCCESAYDNCNEGCRQMPNDTLWEKAKRAACWEGCTIGYGECRAEAFLRNVISPKKNCPPSLEDDSSSSEECVDDGDDGSGGGGDDGGGTPPTSCHSEYIYIDVDYGDGNWITVWEGWAQVCG
jgi:hypothetical protein